jgi:hypothetical protein
MRRRCLSVDDNAVYLREARNLLRRQGMSVVGDSPAIGFLPNAVLSRGAIDGVLGDRGEGRGV